MEVFSETVCLKIGHYVYILKDPRTGGIFYIGKGAGNRVFQHVRGDLDYYGEADKINLIRDIIRTGYKVELYLLRHGLTKDQALEIESACIDLLGLDNLTNLVKGHKSWERGLKTVQEVVQHYDAKTITITEPAIIININRLYVRFMNDDDLYKATKESWVLGPRKYHAQYILASYRGLVREVYVIENWYPVNGRWGFNGRIAPQEIRAKYLNNSLDAYIKKGSQNPIRYTY